MRTAACPCRSCGPFQTVFCSIACFLSFLPSFLLFLLPDYDLSGCVCSWPTLLHVFCLWSLFVFGSDRMVRCAVRSFTGARRVLWLRANQLMGGGECGWLCCHRLHRTCHTLHKLVIGMLLGPLWLKMQRLFRGTCGARENKHISWLPGAKQKEYEWCLYYYFV